MELEKGAVIFNRVIRGDLDNGGTFVSRPKWREGGRDVVIFRKRVPIRGKKMCQFPAFNFVAEVTVHSDFCSP